MRALPRPETLPKFAVWQRCTLRTHHRVDASNFALIFEKFAYRLAP